MIVNANIAMQALTAITNEAPEFIYNPNGARNCYYQIDDEPSCGVGKALAWFGMTTYELWRMDNAGDVAHMSGVELPPGWYVTDHARAILTEFQCTQDNGHTWRTALEYAHDVYMDWKDGK